MSVEQMAIVLHHSRARGTDKLVLVGIANHDGDGGAWPTVDTLARYANVDERSIRLALRRLKLLGELEVEVNAGGDRRTPGDRRPNLYTIKVHCPSWCDGSKHHRRRDDDEGEGDGEHQRDGGNPTSPRGGNPSSGRGGKSDVAPEEPGFPSRGEADFPLTVLGTVHNLSVDEPRSTPQQPKRRAPHGEVWAALLDACGIDEAEATGSAISAWQRATASLRRAGATAEEIRTRAAEFTRRWPNATLTPTALERRWAEIPCQPAAADPVADAIEQARGRGITWARTDVTVEDALAAAPADPAERDAFTRAFHGERARLAERSSA